MRRLRIATLAVFVTGLLVAASLGIYRIPRSSETNTGSQAFPRTDESIALVAAKVQLRPKVRVPSRPVYQYSVVRGGVQSGEELRRVMAEDRQVADHYAGFRFARARITRLQHAQLMYLSYRKNGRIFWTRGAHVIPAGETVITDGEITGRTRCANRLSVRKQLSISPDEPPQAALEQVEPPAMLPPENINFPALYHNAILTGPGEGTSPWIGPSGGDPWLILPPPLPIGFGGGLCKPAVKKAADHDFGDGKDNDGDADDCRPVKPPPATVPEPSTWLLLGTGLAAVFIVLFTRTPAADRT